MLVGFRLRFANSYQLGMKAESWTRVAKIAFSSSGAPRCGHQSGRRASGEPDSAQPAGWLQPWSQPGNGGGGWLFTA